MAAPIHGIARGGGVGGGVHGMELKESCAISLRCATRAGAIETLREVERLLVRGLGSLQELHMLLDRWSDPIAIDTCLKGLIESTDLELDPGGRVARDRLGAMRVATRARADGHRPIRVTRRVRPVRSGG